MEDKVEESKLQKSFKETPLKREVTIVANENEASDNDDKTEKESVAEIKKLDTQVRHHICFSKDCFWNLEMDFGG